jgi:hypothetical protein
MKAVFIRSLWIVCALLALPSGLYAQTPMGTTFTYQGRLTDGGTPANGEYDFRFSLYDAPAGGSQAGSTLAINGVPVANGLFTVPLDFGDYLRGDALWLEIEVAPYKSGTFTLLSPRQELTPAPYAMYAQTAGSVVGGISGSGSADYVPKFTATRTIDNSTIFDNGTNVGIGTAAPAQRLSVNGLIESLTGGFKFPDGTIQTTADTGGTCLWQQSGSNIYYDSGNVGIGTAGPSAKLDVGGDLRTAGSAAVGTTIHSDIRLYVQTNTHPYGMYSANAKSGGTNTGIRGSASGSTTGDNYGIYGESSGSSSKNYGVYGFAATPGAGTNYGIYGYAANSGTGSAYAGYFSGDVRTTGRAAVGTDVNTEVTMNVYTSSNPYGLYCENAKAGGMNTGVRAVASGNTTGDSYGLYSLSSSPSGTNYGVYGFAATASSGTNYGVYGYGSNSGTGSGYAGYFSGTTILYGNVGVSTTSIPAGRRINTDTGAYLSTGGTWTNSSSRDQKENIKPADGRAVLEKLVTVPVSTWNYKAEDAAVRHIGPMAQDLYEAFELNGNNETISTIDTGGLSFAAIQGLYQIIQEQQKQIEAMKSEIDRLKTHLRNQA